MLSSAMVELEERGGRVVHSSDLLQACWQATSEDCSDRVFLSAAVELLGVSWTSVHCVFSHSRLRLHAQHNTPTTRSSSVHVWPGWPLSTPASIFGSGWAWSTTECVKARRTRDGDVDLLACPR